MLQISILVLESYKRIWKKLKGRISHNLLSIRIILLAYICIATIKDFSGEFGLNDSLCRRETCVLKAQFGTHCSYCQGDW